MNYKKNLLEKITDKTAIIGIVGMGYVGRPLAQLSSGAGYKTIGFVRDPKKAQAINQEKIPNFSSTADKKRLSETNIVLICVQTPVFKNKKPDLKFLKDAAAEVGTHIRPGQLVVIESSIAPGTTRNLFLPILEKSGLVCGKEFFLSFSPERVDPGNTKFKLNQIPKVVSGVEENSLEVAFAFYSKIIDKVVPVSSLETAELVKIFENTFRLINISLVNQVHEYAKAIGVDMWEVVNAASTKPFGFLAHYPGPGIGGHCIPVDPYYLLEDAKKYGIELSLIHEAGKINENQPHKVVARAVEIISGKVINGANHNNNYLTNDINYNSFRPKLSSIKFGVSRFAQPKKKKVLLIGVAYKPDVDDFRESPALEIWELFHREGYKVSYFDPFVPLFNGSRSVKLTDKVIKNHDLVVITTNHSTIDYNWLAELNIPILDTRNVLISSEKPHIYPL